MKVPWIAVLAGLALPLCAQVSLGTSAVAGHVQDASALAVPGAAVELLDVERGAVRRAVTNELGNYSFPGVSPGFYTLKVSKPGFEPFTVVNFQVRASQQATMDAVLKVGTVSEVVSVNAQGEAPLLETSSNALGTIIERERVESLPLNGRNFLELGLIAAGTAPPQGVSTIVNGQTGHPQRSIHIAGNFEGVTGYLVNGIATRGSRIGESSLNLSVAAVDQFKVQMSFFMPDQGPDPGIVSVYTKSGTNQFHGQSFEYVRNQLLDARNYYAPEPEPLHRNQFGAAVGGPILKDRLFFFGHYEGQRQVQAFSQRGFTPSAAMFAGDFSEVPQPIYNPYSFSPQTQTRQPFPNNRIPADLFNPVSKRLLEYYRTGSSYTERPSNLFANPRNLLRDDQFGLRIDATLSDRQSLAGSFMWEDSPVTRQAIMPLSGRSFPLDTQVAALQHTFTFGPALVNLARIGFSRASVFSQGETTDSPTISRDLGIAGSFDTTGIPGIAIQGFTGFGAAFGPVGDTDNNYQIDEAVNWMRGNHSFQFGVGIRYHRSKQLNFNSSARGSLGFLTNYTAQLAPGAGGRLTARAGTGNAFGDFLLGFPNNGGVSGLNPIYFRFVQWMPYFQDTWRVSRSLTLNFGISWYYGTIPDPQGEARNQVGTLDLTTGLLRYSVLGEIPPRLLQPDRRNSTPRFGFAWTPAFLKNIVIRSGVGVYYSDTRLIEQTRGFLVPPFGNPVSFVNSDLTGPPEYQLGRNIFPIITLPPLTREFAVNLPAGFSPSIMGADSKTPYVTQWNLSVQHTLTRNDLVEVNYMGSSSHRQQNRWDLNQCRPGPGLLCDPATRPYLRYNNMLYSVNDGNANYHAMTAKYQHQFSRGFTLHADYTFSKTITDSWEGGGSMQSQIAVCRSCDRGPAAFNVPHRMVLSGIYELPFGRRRAFGANWPRAADLVLGGWNVNAIAVLSTGNTITVTSPNRTSSPQVELRANRLCDGRSSALSDNLRNNGGVFFDTSCYATPAAQHFGNSGRGVMIGPGNNNWDIGVEKTFPLREDVRLRFRGEFFNAWNHAQFANPSINSGDTNFGRVASAGAPRLIQLGMKLSW